MQLYLVREQNLDMVLCIDVSASMAPHLERVKAMALELPETVRRRMQQRGIPVGDVRVRLVLFGDYRAEGANAILTSRFFSLNTQQPQLEAFVEQLRSGAGTALRKGSLEALAFSLRSSWKPEDSLEALAVAISSPWEETAKWREIVLWTDAAPHPMGHNRDVPGYPAQMPGSFGELTRLWQELEGNRRLVLFAPEAEPWVSLVEQWEDTAMFGSRAAEAIPDAALEEILGILDGSL